MTGADDREGAEAVRGADAPDWFARMKGPDAARWQAEFDAWMRHPRNAEAYRQIEAVWTLAGRASPRSRPPSAGEARRWWKVAAMAAAVAGAVTLAALLQLDSARGPVEESAYAAPIGTIRAVRLADGSVVTLDTDSRIAVRFEGPRREVTLLSGRARFAVAHDAARPFVVIAGERAVVATGTLFDVRIRPSGLEVTLIEGGVDLQWTGAPSAGGPRRLHPGETATWTSGPAMMVERAAAGAASWTSGVFSAEGLPLRDLVAEANRYAPRKIVLADPSLGSIQVSGAFRLGDSDALALQLAAALDLRATHRADGTILLARPDRPSGRP